ncbi:ClpP/crotonase [Polychaeton citri CBS 116435]|uniref:3-hydroxyisobutyryl-CoA hydrolase n=1 Tax=Polychaeton citri CBS 116435 TaxID=1314669 RepID=A0A9P4QAH5_9PEZI|nr:ClpP/crotonase [Polychaeton citri CBS 116435]
MARKIVPRLQEWSKSQLANVVIIKGEGRAFCAGGDVAALAQQCEKGAGGQQEAKDYFALEYKLDHMISTYNKPYVALIDGITMGGGVGLSVHAPFRIATENTVFAMPETTIGFFPDVGASFFLPRMDGALGTYLALTSEQLKSVQVFYSGIATHYLHSSSLPDLEARLGELQFGDHANYATRLRLINDTIEEFCTGIPADQPLPGADGQVIGGHIRAAIDYCFQPANDTPEQVLQALEGMAAMQPSPDAPGRAVVASWASRTIETISKRSPTSLRVTLRQLQAGRSWSIAETFKREHQIASRFMEHPDFVEGVSSLLIRKPRTEPKWNPSSIAEVSDEDVDKFLTAKSDFSPLVGFDSAEDYFAYPHAWLGLPRESDVKVEFEKVRDFRKTIKSFLARTNGKQGVREKVQEILERKTEMNGGQLSWKR